MKIKRSSADDWFSKCVRIRSNWICENCGIDLSNDKGRLHCSHFISRSYNIVRYNPSNALSHCVSCHDILGGGRWGGGNIAEFTANYDRTHGEENRELMRRLSKYPFNKHKHYIKEISDFYREAYKEMEEERKQGNESRLEFSNYTNQEINALIKQLRGEILG